MKQNRLGKYLLRTYLTSWVSWGILIVLVNNGVAAYSSPIGFVFFVIGGFGPTIAAITVQEKRDPKSIAKFVFGANHKAVPYVLLFCLVLAATFCLSSRELQPNMAFCLFPVYWLEMIALGGLEELGWRGVMQPALEKSMPLPVAVLLTSITWSVWHLPLWFVAGSSQQEFPFAAFAAFALVLSFALAVIYKKTNGVLYCCLFHGFSNVLVSYFVLDVNWIFVSGSMMIVIVSLLIWYIGRRTRTIADV
jgi:membrane protease YdiL (CAAX protease family)